MKLLIFPLHVNMKPRGLHSYDHISQETAGNNIWKCRFLDKVSLFGLRVAVVDRNQLKLRVHWVSKATQSKLVEQMRQQILQNWINQQTKLFSMWATLQLFTGGPIDLRLTCRSYILDAIFRDTSLYRVVHTQMRKLNTLLERIFEGQIWGQVGYRWKDHPKCSSHNPKKQRAI